jgi:enoyl-CoA hydratase
MERKTLDTIVYETDGPIARIILNTPEKANVQTAQQVYDMEDALRWADRDEQIKVLILKANGKGFCAGHAIVDMEDMPEVYPTTGPTFERTWKVHNYDLFVWPPLHLFEFPKATISQVHGYCLGGGTVYSYLTDMTIAADDAYFQMPLPQGFGLPGAQTMIEPWALGNWKRAYEYLYLGKTLDAEQALEWGLINQITTRDQLEEVTEQTAATIARMPMTTILAIKQGMKRAWELQGMRVHLQTSADFTSICSGSSDVQEFMMARAGKRPRQFAAQNTELLDGKG